MGLAGLTWSQGSVQFWRLRRSQSPQLRGWAGGSRPTGLANGPWQACREWEQEVLSSSSHLVGRQSSSVHSSSPAFISQAGEERLGNGTQGEGAQTCIAGDSRAVPQLSLLPNGPMTPPLRSCSKYQGVRL